MISHDIIWARWVSSRQFHNGVVSLSSEHDVTYKLDQRGGSESAINEDRTWFRRPKATNDTNEELRNQTMSQSMVWCRGRWDHRLISTKAWKVAMFGRVGNTRSANLLNQKRLNARSPTTDNKMRPLYSSQAVNHLQNLYFRVYEALAKFWAEIGPALYVFIQLEYTTLNV